MSDDLDEVGDPEFSALIAPNEDIAWAPNDVADSQEAVRRHIPSAILRKFEAYSYRNASLILSVTRSEEFADIIAALESFTLTTKQIRMAGGNESEIPKAFSALLRPKGWHETIVRGDLLVRQTWAEPFTRKTKRGRVVQKFEKRTRETTRERFLDGHKIDYVKDRVAFDLEWNSKDQTFDRDLYAFSAFAQCGVIDVGILVTRSKGLNDVFPSLGPALKRDGTIDTKPNGSPKPTSSKYGASTTWMGKLLYRLNAGRNGSCPVLALGILPACISDLGAS